MSVRSLIRLLGPGAIVKHYGPGAHPSGSPQSVHGNGSAGIDAATTTNTTLSPVGQLREQRRLEALREARWLDEGNKDGPATKAVTWFLDRDVKVTFSDRIARGATLPTVVEIQQAAQALEEAGIDVLPSGLHFVGSTLSGRMAETSLWGDITVFTDNFDSLNRGRENNFIVGRSNAFDSYIHEVGHLIDIRSDLNGDDLYAKYGPAPTMYANEESNSGLVRTKLGYRTEYLPEAFMAAWVNDERFDAELRDLVMEEAKKVSGKVAKIKRESACIYGLSYEEYLANKVAKLVKHYGPGPHPGTGTPQSVHGAPFLNVGVGETVNREVITDAEGNPAPISMAVLPPDVQAKVIAKAKEFGRTPEDIQANINMVFESAADRYESMNADRSWHEGDIAEWLKDREYEGYRDMLIEQKDGEWRWAKDAGTKLRDIDRFYASHHEWLYELAEDHDQPFGEVVGYHAAISPGLRARENFRFSELAVQYWEANPKFTAEEAAYINEWLETDQETILAKGGWRAERIAPQLDYRVEAGDSYRQVMKEGGPEAIARIMYRKTLHNGESLSLGKGYRQHATGLAILYNDLDVPTTLSGPKVRSFYNNIVDPFADRDDITIDFQTMDASFNGYGTGDSDFPTDFLSSPAYKGVKLGVRPLVADAVRAGGQAISSRIDFDNAAEMQEVLWAEWKRGLPTSGNGRSRRHGEGKWGLEEIRRIS